MHKSAIKVFLWFYDLAWKILLPVLRLNYRLAEGYDQRILKKKLSEADLWIQAASVGESYLACEILKNLRLSYPIKVIVTTNTHQGLEILKKLIIDIIKDHRKISVSLAYFPFDRPSIMEKAVRQVCPKIMVLLESEIWPGLLYVLKQYNCTTIIINGRITRKSLRKYLVWPSLWRTIRPDKIFAISEKDASRFAKLFGIKNVNVMPNIKFDRLSYNTEGLSDTKETLGSIIGPGTYLIILGSVRQEEETAVEKIILEIRHRQPDIVIGLFPRHLQRIKYWEKALGRLSIPFILRSDAKTHVHSGTVILWDTFGELNFAYKHSRAAFVGGSLAPLGGQNFLEALTSGVIPVIGPYWENFYWVGNEIVKKGIVRIASGWKEVADILLENTKKPFSHEDVLNKALMYLKNRQGGTAQTCNIITEILNNR